MDSNNFFGSSFESFESFSVSKFSDDGALAEGKGEEGWVQVYSSSSSAKVCIDTPKYNPHPPLASGVSILLSAIS